MGRYGLHSGYGKFQNIQSGSVNITVDGSGDGTQAVVFPNKMKSVPIVTMTSQEADTTGTLAISARTVAGFTARVDASSVTSDTLTCGWVAMDQKPTN